NPTLCRMVGTPADELRGKRILDFQPDRAREEIRRAHEEFFRTGAAMPSTTELSARDGRVLDIVLRSSLLVTEDGRKLRVSAVTDVTEMRRTEQALRESNQRLLQLAAIIESSDDAIIGRTLDGIVTSWNTGAERLYGYSAAEMIGRTADCLVPPGCRDEFPELTAKLRRGESVAGHESTRLCKDNRRIQVSLTLSPIKDEHGSITGISAIGRDITERKLLEQQLIQSQKMEAVALLAGGVAHDFNNLLTIIIGYGRLLLVETGASSDVREYADEILYSAERASALTGQLLAFSRRQVVQPRVIDLNEAVQSMHRMLERILGEHIQLNTVEGESLGRVKAD